MNKSCHSLRRLTHGTASTILACDRAHSSESNVGEQMDPAQLDWQVSHAEIYHYLLRLGEMVLGWRVSDPWHCYQLARVGEMVVGPVVRLVQ